MCPAKSDGETAQTGHRSCVTIRSGGSLRSRLLIDAVQLLAGAEALGHLPVDLAAIARRVDVAERHARLRRRLRREVAFVRDAGYLVVKAEREQYLGGAREQ